jgi:hypothetical protein
MIVAKAETAHSSGLQQQWNDNSHYRKLCHADRFGSHRYTCQDSRYIYEAISATELQQLLSDHLAGL